MKRGGRSAGETDYISLIRKATEYQVKNDISVSSGDSVWVVADADVNYNNPDPVENKNQQLARARKMAKAKGIELLISNPCFEFWYLLHFRYTTKHLKDYPAVRTMLVEHLTDYKKSKDVYAELNKYTKEAIERAGRLEQYHQQNGVSAPFDLHTNPFTDVYHLIELLID